MFKSRFILNISKRQLSNTINVVSLKFSEIGDPLKVVHKSESKIEAKLRENEVLVKYLAAAVHPSDILTINGQYGVKPSLPAIGGNEGYGKVIDVGVAASLKVGDFVIPKLPSTGTWLSHKIFDDTELIKINKPLPPDLGTVVSVNPSTAYRMLKDFVHLNPGDVFIQNGGTSAVAIYATQLAKLWDVKSISIIRERGSIEDTETVKNVLQNQYGATFVLTEKEAITKLPDITKRIGPAKLALNCVGGKGIISLIRALKHSGIIVTYGGMNGLPLQISVSPLIFSDIQIRGFWVSNWIKDPRNDRARREMLDYLCDAFHSNQIKPSPVSAFDFSTQWRDCLSKSILSDEKPKDIKMKNILVMNDV